jgi:murein DD-endopeptidase MepM/ murein hydrolase activator NlpD
LHLQKAYVTKGQTVTRGQKIALSGNSGRSTGAHLHFELLINNKPVNAMKADIPIMKEIEGKDRQKFKSMVSNYLKEMGKA